MAMKEFTARLESDAGFAAMFADVMSEEEFFNLAKSEGYDLENLSDEELDMVAGGSVWDIFKWIKKNITEPIVKHVVEPVVEYITDPK